MKLFCDGLDLSDAVLKVSKALSVNSSNPVLQGIKITAKDDTLTLTATDMELTIEKKIRADVLMEGETVVVGKYFIDFVKKIEKEQVELCKLDDNGLQIKYGDSESELQTFDVSNFPVIEKDEESSYFEIKQEDFKKIVERTVFACSMDDGRPILKGCLFETEKTDNEEGLLTVVALDGFRMSVIKKAVKLKGDFKTVIPSRTLVEITRILEKGEENVKIVLHKNTLFVEVGNTRLISRLIEGEFVKYNHILPTTFSNKVTLNKQAFLNSIERASIFARSDKYNIIKMDVKESVMTVSAKSEIGSFEEPIAVELKGKDMVIAFNGKYLSDFLKVIDEDFVTINLNTAIDPCVIKPVGQDEFLYLVLPVRINA